MAGSRRRRAIPTQLDLGVFEQCVLPHLSTGSRGPAPKLSLFKIFNYILQLLYPGCQWKELPIERSNDGCPEIHYTRIYRTFRRWEADGCIDAIFADMVMQLHQDALLDITVIHGDGTTTAAKKGGDNIGFNGHNALPAVMRIARDVGMDLQGSMVSLDGVYDGRANRKAIFNRGLMPDINPNVRGRKQPKRCCLN